MIFSDPIKFTEAMRIANDRGLLPTNLSSAQIAQWDNEIKRFSVFSARTNHAGYLQDIKDVVSDLLAGKYNEAEARARLQAELAALDYDPSRGFPGLEEGIPPADAGSLRDLSSDKRTQLVIRTQMRQMANLGYRKQGMTEGSLYAFPAWELVRIYPRLVPRGSEKSRSAGWRDRWAATGTALRDGRMIARKDDPVWAALGDRELFSDAIGTDYPPFAFNSGMGWQAVPRSECEKVGISLDGIEVPKAIAIDKQQLGVKGIDDEFLRNLRDALDVEIKEGYARLKK